MIGAMHASPTRPGPAARHSEAAGRWLFSWWRIVHLAAVLLALALSPSSYAPAQRRLLLQRLYQATAPALLWFGVISTLISLVLIRIVLVTALSYGLSQYALEMVVRVLVLELIPLTAALFAALRTTIPQAAEIALLRSQGRWERLDDPLRTEVLPRVASGVFCALLLAAVSCVVALVVAYVSVYGVASAGFAAYTHTVGHVFSPAVSLIFGLKILLFGLAVALVPVATVMDAPLHARTSTELRGLVRMFVVIVLIEAASLVGNYY
jgi:phospholipid/cholesterol/gamma-HCH transport system permease protein